MTSINNTSTWQCGSALCNTIYSLYHDKYTPSKMDILPSGNNALIANVLKKLLNQQYSAYFVISMLWTTETGSLGS